MAIRIDCQLPGFEGSWIEFREKGWSFGDRRRIVEAMNDAEALRLILGYVEAWNFTAIDGSQIPVPKEIGGLDDADDALVVWLVRAWFEARQKRLEFPKAS